MPVRYTFRGGIRLPRSKKNMAQPTRRIDPPAQIVLYLRAYDGVECVCHVREGDTVERGQCIGRPRSEGGLPRYSPVSGRVLSVEQIPDENGTAVSCVRIENDMRDRTHAGVHPYDKKLQDSTREELLSYIRESGVCGADGRPLYLRMAGVDSGADTLLVNCVETQPGMYAMGHLLRETPEQVINGAKIIMKTLSLPHAVLAVQDDDFTAVNTLSDTVGKNRLFEIRLFRTRYPQENPACIVSAMRGIPLEMGRNIVDYNMLEVSGAECAAVYRAFATGLPALEKTVYVDGDCVRESACISCPVGTPFADLFAFCGGLVKEPEVILSGGVMNGIICPPDAAVDSDTVAVWATDDVRTRERAPVFHAWLDEQSLAQLRQRTVCVRCGACAQACPAGILPHTLVQAVQKGRFSAQEDNALSACDLCGACAYVCPAGIPLTRWIAYAKQREVYPQEWRAESDGEETVENEED